MMRLDYQKNRLCYIPLTNLVYLLYIDTDLLNSIYPAGSILNISINILQYFCKFNIFLVILH